MGDEENKVYGWTEQHMIPENEVDPYLKRVKRLQISSREAVRRELMRVANDFTLDTEIWVMADLQWIPRNHQEVCDMQRTLQFEYEPDDDEDEEWEELQEQADNMFLGVLFLRLCEFFNWQDVNLLGEKIDATWPHTPRPYTLYSVKFRCIWGGRLGIEWHNANHELRRALLNEDWPTELRRAVLNEDWPAEHKPFVFDGSNVKLSNETIWNVMRDSLHRQKRRLATHYDNDLVAKRLGMLHISPHQRYDRARNPPPLPEPEVLEALPSRALVRRRARQAQHQRPEAEEEPRRKAARIAEIYESEDEE